MLFSAARSFSAFQAHCSKTKTSFPFCLFFLLCFQSRCLFLLCCLDQSHPVSHGNRDFLCIHNQLSVMRASWSFQLSRCWWPPPVAWKLRGRTHISGPCCWQFLEQLWALFLFFPSLDLSPLLALLQPCRPRLSGSPERCCLVSVTCAHHVLPPNNSFDWLFLDFEISASKDST